MRRPERAAQVEQMRAAGATLAQIAAALGVTERTVSAYVTALGMAHEAPAHGMSRRYSEGCRCEECREAHRVTVARMRARRRDDGMPGSYSAPLGHDTVTLLAASHAEAQERTRAAAHRAYRPWTDADLAIALDPRLSATEAAERLGRSRAAVHHVRTRTPGWRGV